MDDEGLADTRVLKVLGAIVEDEVDTSELLESLETHAGELALEHGAAEAVDVAGSALGHLVVVVGLDLGNLGDDGLVVGRETAELAERPGGLVHLSLLDEESRSLGKDQHAKNENDRPGELDGNWDTVGARVVAFVGGVIDDGGKEKTDGDRQLVSTNDGTTNPLGSRLGLVQRDHGGDETDTETSKEATSEEQGQGDSGSLEDDTQVEDPAGGDEGPATTDGVGEED